MNGYLLAYFILVILGLGIKIESHGKPKKGNENFWYSLIAIILGFWLLYMGGCFDHVI